MRYPLRDSSQSPEGDFLQKKTEGAEKFHTLRVYY